MGAGMSVAKAFGTLLLFLVGALVVLFLIIFGLAMATVGAIDLAQAVLG